MPYKEAWDEAEKDPDGIRRNFPEKIIHVKEYTKEEVAKLLTRHISDDKLINVVCEPAKVSWKDWPKEELKLRSECCPYCFLQHGQGMQWKIGKVGYKWVTIGHRKNCPLEEAWRQSIDNPGIYA